MEMKYNLTVTEKQIDYTLNIIFFILGLFAFVKSLEYTQTAQIWPRNVSIVIMATSILLLFRSYLPFWLAPLVQEGSYLEDETEKIAEEVEDEEQEEIEDEAEMGRYPIRNSVFTVISMLGYLILGFGFGLLYATPIYVVFYTWWFKKPWYQIILLTVLATLIAYAFLDLLYLPIDEGILTEMVTG